jgi:hypothetical protein
MATKSDIVPTASLVNALMAFVKLNEKNYIYWAQYVEVFLKGKGLYIHSTSDKPQNISSTSLWEQEDNQITFLLPRIFRIISVICTLVPGISLGFMRCVNNILGLSKVHRLWTDTTIKLWSFVRR